MSRSRITPSILTAVLAFGAPLGAADEHAGHDHAAADAHAHGTTEAVGSVDIGAFKVAVSASGAIAAGSEWHVEMRLTPDQPAPKTIRVWVGAENGRGSMKARAEKDAKGVYGAHVEVPSPIPTGGNLWITIEPEDGQTAKGSLALPKTKAEAGHHEGDGHKH